MNPVKATGFRPNEVNRSLKRQDSRSVGLADPGTKHDQTLMRYGTGLEASGRTAALDVLDALAARRPTALFICHQERAVGAIIAIHVLGLEPPGDVPLTSFGNSRLALHEPPISEVAQPTHGLGSPICRVLIRALEGAANQAPQHLRLDAPFIARGSVAPT